MAGQMTGNKIIVRKGDSFDIVLQFKHGDMQPMDLSQCALKMSVRDRDNELMFTKDGEIIEVLAGKARLKLKPSDTDMVPGIYKTDIQLTLKNGDVHTVFPQDIHQVGAFIVTEEVTQS